MKLFKLIFILIFSTLSTYAQDSNGIIYAPINAQRTLNFENNFTLVETTTRSITTSDNSETNQERILRDNRKRNVNSTVHPIILLSPQINNKVITFSKQTESTNELRIDENFKSTIHPEVQLSPATSNLILWKQE